MEAGLMGKPTQSYRELRVYRLAFDTAMCIFELTKTWSKAERYALTDQIRRSSRSVCANEAEAWRKRRYSAHFVSKLSDADTEATKTEVWLDFALQCGYLDEGDHARLRDNCDHVCRMLSRMMAHPKQWSRRNPW